MKFEYQSYPIDPSPEFPQGRLYRPMVPIRVKGLTGSISFLALLDTGADAKLLPRSLGKAIGVRIDESRHSLATGIGGEQLVVHLGEVGLEVETAEERYRWWTSVGFAAFPDPENEIAILGHAGGLDLFVANFDGDRREVELQPTPELLQRQKRVHR